MSDVANTHGGTDESSGNLRTVILGCLLFVAGNGIAYMLPPFLAQIGGRLSLDPEQLGTLAAADSAGIAITSLCGPLWIARINLRACMIFGILICVTLNVITAHAPSYHAVLATRFVVGLFGEGVLATVGIKVLGMVRNVDRGFAIALTAAVAFGAGVIAAAATLERLFPTIGVLGPLIASAAITVLCVQWFSNTLPATSAVDLPVSPGTGTRPVILALVAQAIWFAGPGAFWAFAEEIATRKAVAADSVELALSIGELAGLVGSLLAAWLGHRWGRLRPIIAASIGMALAAELYMYSATAAMFAMALSVFYALWNFCVVYQLTLVSSLDRTGRIAVVMPAAQVFGLSIGPFATGIWVARSGYSVVLLATAAFMIVGVALYVACFYETMREGRATHA